LFYRTFHQINNDSFISQFLNRALYHSSGHCWLLVTTVVPSRQPSVVPSKISLISLSQVPSVIPSQTPYLAPSRQPSVTHTMSIAPSQVPSIMSYLLHLQSAHLRARCQVLSRLDSQHSTQHIANRSSKCVIQRGAQHFAHRSPKCGS
jgi:hypothetical protein